jgi:hypothetical protein
LPDTVAANTTKAKAKANAAAARAPVPMERQASNTLAASSARPATLAVGMLPTDTNAKASATHAAIWARRKAVSRRGRGG